MIRLMKVSGESLAPSINPGDYILVFKAAFSLRKLKAGDLVVFHHPVYGRLVKRLETITPDGEELFVVGENPDSTDSRQFGLIPRRWVIGKVVLHISRPTV